jgi:hypothetical protein
MNDSPYGGSVTTLSTEFSGNAFITSKQSPKKIFILLRHGAVKLSYSGLLPNEQSLTPLYTPDRLLQWSHAALERMNNAAKEMIFHLLLFR